MSDKFVDDFEVSITTHLKSHNNRSIKKILDVLDLLELPSDKKKKIRKIVLEELNDYYNEVCKVLTYIQENGR